MKKAAEERQMPDQTNHPRTPNSHIKAGWLPILVGGLLCTLAVLLWWTLDEREQTNLHGKIKAEAEYLAYHMNDDVRNRIQYMRNIARRWEINRGTPKEEFVSDTSAFLSDVAGSQSLNWADKNAIVRWTVPREGNERAQNLNLTLEETQRIALEKAKATKSPTMTAPIDLVQGGKGFQVYFPIYVRGEFDGFVLAIFRIQEWLDHVISLDQHHNLTDDSRISVFFDDVLVFKQAGQEAPGETGLGAIANAEILDHRFSVHILPTQTYIEQSKTLLPKLTAVFGVLLSVLVAFVVHLLGKTSVEARATHTANAALEVEIREHEKAEDELQHALSRFDMATKAGGIGVWAWDVSTGILTWNERMYDLYDIPPDVMPTYGTWRSAVHPDDLPATESLLKDAVEGTMEFNTTFRVILTTGAVRYLGAAARVEKDRTSKPQRVTGINWDLTDRRQAEETLKKSEGQVRLLLNSTAEAIYGIDLKGDCTFANPSCLRMLGYADTQQLLGRNMHRLIHHSHPDGSPMAIEECSIYRAFREGTGVHRDDEVLWKADGTCFPVEYWSYPQIVNGDVSGAVVTFIDITERKHAEKALRESRQQFQGLVETLYDWVWEVDTEGRYSYVSPQVKNILGYEPHEILGKTPVDLMSPGDARRVSAEFGELIKERKPIVALENINIHKDGHLVVLETNGLPFSDADGNFKGYRGTDRDITVRKQAEKLLATERQRLSYILEGTNVGTWEWNVQTGETIFNERWAEVVGYTLQELAPVSIDTWVKFAHPDDLKVSADLLAQHFRKELPYYECEMRMRHKNGNWVWVLDRGRVATWMDNGSPLVMSGTHQDITERKLAEEQIHHLATHDGLTDLPSLSLAKDRLSMALGMARRNKTAMAVMFIDLDGFKAVNDTLGHDAGDYVLKEVAQRLLSCARETDTVARVGGDEFLLISTGLRTPENAAQIAEKMIHVVSQPVIVNGRQAVVSASIGIALYPDHGEEMDQLIKQADDAMYRIKNTGKNEFGFADTTIK